MRSGFFTAVFLTFYLALPAQNVQPSEAFPFSITLFRTDSSTLPSAQVLKKGKPTVLAFWLTTCLPCHIELGSYAKNYESWKKEVDFNLFAISIDFQERFAKVQEMTREKKWPFPVYWDAHRAFKNILPGGLNGLPQVFLFDKEGKLVWQHKRYVSGDEAELFSQIKALK